MFTPAMTLQLGYPPGSLMDKRLGSWAQGPEFESRWGDARLNQGLSARQMRRLGSVKPHYGAFSQLSAIQVKALKNILHPTSKWKKIKLFELDKYYMYLHSLKNWRLHNPISFRRVCTVNFIKPIHALKSA